MNMAMFQIHLTCLFSFIKVLLKIFQNFLIKICIFGYLHKTKSHFEDPKCKGQTAHFEHYIE